MEGKNHNASPLIIRETVSGYEVLEGQEHLLERLKVSHPELTIEEAVKKGLIEVMTDERETCSNSRFGRY